MMTNFTSIDLKAVVLMGLLDLLVHESFLDMAKVKMLFST